MTSVQIEDFENLSKLDYIDWEFLRNKTLLITGATGLIGNNLVNALRFINERIDLHVKLFLLVRDRKKAVSIYGQDDSIKYYDYNINKKIDINISPEYVVHLASPTGSSFFSKNPCETLLQNINGTKNILEFCKYNSIKKLIYLSTMEVYEQSKKGKKISENSIGSFNPLLSRNSYPIAKISCEALCRSYYSEYQIPTIILRATQIFGPGVMYNDQRIFAQLMRCVIEKQDIVLNSPGLTERCYLYTADAVSAIILAMLKGEEGEAYTIANESTYCSIKSMAELVSKKIALNNISVRYKFIDDITKLGYLDTVYLDLDTSKFRALGWKPIYDLESMFRRMIDDCGKR